MAKESSAQLHSSTQRENHTPIPHLAGRLCTLQPAGRAKFAICRPNNPVLKKQRSILNNPLLQNGKFSAAKSRFTGAQKVNPSKKYNLPNEHSPLFRTLRANI